MEWMEFVAAMAGHLAWPLTLIALYLLLRDKIATLLEQLARLKYKDIELDFEKVRKQAEELAGKPTPNLPAQPETPVFRSLEEQVVETAERAPAASILLAWSTVETALTTAVTRLAVSPDAPSYRSSVHNIEALHAQGKISRQQMRLLNELRLLRNKLAHDSATNVAVSEVQALEYASAARTLVTFLNGLDRVYKIVETPTGSWIDLPAGFSEAARRDDSNYWHYSAVTLKDSGLTAGVGPWSKGGEGNEEYSYYGIDVELQAASGSKTIAELLVDLRLVDPSILSMKASDIVNYDESSKIVTFDLGLSVFRYQFSE